MSEDIIRVLLLAPIFGLAIYLALFTEPWRYGKYVWLIVWAVCGVFIVAFAKSVYEVLV